MPVDPQERQAKPITTLPPLSLATLPVVRASDWSSIAASPGSPLSSRGMRRLLPIPRELDELPGEEIYRFAYANTVRKLLLLVALFGVAAVLLAFVFYSDWFDYYNQKNLRIPGNVSGKTARFDALLTIGSGPDIVLDAVGGTSFFQNGLNFSSDVDIEGISTFFGSATSMGNLTATNSLLVDGTLSAAAWQVDAPFYPHGLVESFADASLNDSLAVDGVLTVGTLQVLNQSNTANQTFAFGGLGAELNATVGVLQVLGNLYTASNFTTLSPVAVATGFLSPGTAASAANASTNNFFANISSYCITYFDTTSRIQLPAGYGIYQFNGTGPAPATMASFSLVQSLNVWKDQVVLGGGSGSSAIFLSNSTFNGPTAFSSSSPMSVYGTMAIGGSSTFNSDVILPAGVDVLVPSSSDMTLHQQLLAYQDVSLLGNVSFLSNVSLSAASTSMSRNTTVYGNMTVTAGQQWLLMDNSVFYSPVVQILGGSLAVLNSSTAIDNRLTVFCTNGIQLEGFLEMARLRVLQNTNLTVALNTTFAGFVNMDAFVDIGALYVRGNFHVMGNATFLGSFISNASVQIQSSLDVHVPSVFSSSVDMQSSLVVSGTATFYSNLTIYQSSVFYGSLLVMPPSSVSSAYFNVTGTSYLMSPTDVALFAEMKSSAFFQNATFVGGSAIFQTNATFGSNVTVDGGFSSGSGEDVFVRNSWSSVLAGSTDSLFVDRNATFFSSMNVSTNLTTTDWQAFGNVVVNGPSSSSSFLGPVTVDSSWFLTNATFFRFLSGMSALGSGSAAGTISSAQYDGGLLVNSSFVCLGNASFQGQAFTATFSQSLTVNNTLLSTGAVNISRDLYMETVGNTVQDLYIANDLMVASALGASTTLLSSSVVFDTAAPVLFSGSSVVMDSVKNLDVNMNSYFSGIVSALGTFVVSGTASNSTVENLDVVSSASLTFAGSGVTVSGTASFWSNLTVGPTCAFVQTSASAPVEFLSEVYFSNAAVSVAAGKSVLVDSAVEVDSPVQISGHTLVINGALFFEQSSSLVGAGTSVVISSGSSFTVAGSLALSGAGGTVFSDLVTIGGTSGSIVIDTPTTLQLSGTGSAGGVALGTFTMAGSSSNAISVGTVTATSFTVQGSSSMYSVTFPSAPNTVTFATPYTPSIYALELFLPGTSTVSKRCGVVCLQISITGNIAYSNYNCLIMMDFATASNCAW